MQPKVVLVTGGTGTLGRAIVQAIGQTGASPQPVQSEAQGAVQAGAWRVVANYLHNSERVEALWHATGCELRQTDVSDAAQVAALFADLPPLFAVVHAAGITRDALLLRQTAATWNETLRVNADGAFLVTQAALGKLQDGGRLILLASQAGEHGNAGQAAYAASKAAVLALAKCAAREGAARGLCVNAICPGVVPSAMTAGLSAEQLARLQQRSVFATYDSAVALGTAEQVAATVQWLLSDAAYGITGQVIHCDSRI